MATTWDSTSKRSDVVLTNSDKTATSNAGVYGGARTVHSVSSGKVYIELRADNAGAIGFGVANASHAVNNGSSYAGDDANSYATYQSGAGYYNGSNVGGLGFTTGDRMCFALDRTASLLWYRKNNGTWSPSGDPAAGTGGYSISGITGAVYFVGEFESNGDVATLYSASGEWLYSAPSGYSEINAGGAATKAIPLPRRSLRFFNRRF